MTCSSVQSSSFATHFVFTVRCCDYFDLLECPIMLRLVFATLGVRFLCDSGSGIGHDYRLPPPFGVSTAFFLQPLS
eukprot:1856997-Rhodomonas_salina.1